MSGFGQNDEFMPAQFGAGNADLGLNPQESFTI